jgi:hypothetical protein
MSQLITSDWSEFEEEYQRVLKASEQLFRVKMDERAIMEDLDNLKRLRCISL